MAPMENGSLMLALREWEVIAACVFFMLLLPLIFFIASARRRPRRLLPVRKKRAVRASGVKAGPAAPREAVPDEGRDSTQ